MALVKGDFFFGYSCYTLSQKCYLATLKQWIIYSDKDDQDRRAIMCIHY